MLSLFEISIELPGWYVLLGLIISISLVVFASISEVIDLSEDSGDNVMVFVGIAIWLLIVTLMWLPIILLVILGLLVIDFSKDVGG